MDYDPVKDRLGAWFDRGPFRFRVFFFLLHLFFLRAWHVRRALRQSLKRRSDQPSIRVLDAGTGFGQFADYLIRQNDRVHVSAVDIKADYLERLASYFTACELADRLTIRVDDLTELQTEGPFDLILSVDVMEHIEDDRAVFRHFERVLKPGGEVIINTPSDQGGSAVGGEGGESFIGEHVRDGYGAEEIREKLTKAGLEPLEVLYTYGTWGSLAWRILIQLPMRMLGATLWALPLVALYYVLVLPLGLMLNVADMIGLNRTGTGLLVKARKPV